MSDPFLGQITLYAFNFAPKGWALCNGQQLPINQNQALFALLGTTYGGNGQTTFALPDLRGRVPAHMGQGLIQGQALGETAHTLSIGEMAAHNHTPQGSTAVANTITPAGAVLAAANNVYTAPSTLVALNPASITNAGGSQAHDNMQPYLTLSFCIALVGIFPSRN